MLSRWPFLPSLTAHPGIASERENVTSVYVPFTLPPLGDHAVTSKLSYLMRVSNGITNQISILIGMFGVRQMHPGTLVGYHLDLYLMSHCFLFGHVNVALEQTLAVDCCLSPQGDWAIVISTIDICGWIVLCLEGSCPVTCTICSHISGLYPLGASSTSSGCNSQNVSGHYHMSSGWQHGCRPSDGDTWVTVITPCIWEVVL